MKSRTRTVALILAVLLVIGLIWDINAGYTYISPVDMLKIIFGQGSRGLRYTFLELRLPRVITAMLVGMALSVSGSILQGTLKNDMAEPGLLGINAGAGLAIALFVVFVSGTTQGFSYLLPLLAFAGSAGVAFLEYKLASVRGKLRPKRLLLIGVAIAAAVSSLTAILMLRMPDSDYAFVQSWLAGSIWGASTENAVLLAAGVLALSFLAYYKARTLNVLNLGEETASGLGVPVQKETLLLMMTAVGLSSFACAVGGGLSFVGLVCPHLARKLTGPNYKSLIGISALTGGVLLVYADIIARTLFLPQEMPVGIVAAVIGAPYFLYLLIKE